jgi:lysozyme
MSPSNKCYDFIRNEEGEVLHFYRDTAGVGTIGIGSTMYKDGSKPKKGDTITHEQAMELLKWEVDNKVSAINGCLKNVVINQNQMDALTSLCYNIGVGAFTKSTVLKRIRANPGDPGIRDAFMMWDKITDPKTGSKIVSDTLHGRRKREADLYFSKQSLNPNKYHSCKQKDL